MNTEPRNIEVWVVLPARVLLLDIAGPMEVLRRANAEQRALQFVVRYIGANSRVTAAPPTSSAASSTRTDRPARARYAAQTSPL